MDENLALLIDFENIATGCDKEGLGRFDIRVVMRRLKDKGRILVARAYADWGRYSRFKLDLVEQGVVMQELTTHGMQAKNRADIALCVDAMELAYTRSYLDTFIILSGDSDFSPLVMRLKELNKRVIGLGTKGSTSRLIADLCDEFLFYDTLIREARKPAPEPVEREGRDDAPSAPSRDEALRLLLETLENLQRDEAGPVHGSVLKTAMKRKMPTFSEVELGFRSFTRFLEAAAQRGVVMLRPDGKAGGYHVEVASGPSPAASEAAPEPAEAPAPRPGALDLGTAADRRRVLHAFVELAAERASRGKECRVEAHTGALVRKLREERAPIPVRIVKGIVNGLVAAGALVDAEGRPVRSPRAAFVAPTDPATLDDVLWGWAATQAVDQGGDEGEDPHADLSADELPPPPEQVESAPAFADDLDPTPVPAEPEREQADAARRARGRRGRGRKPAADGANADAPAEPVSEPAAPEAAPEPVAAEPAADEAAAEGASGRRRSSRNRRGSGRGPRQQSGTSDQE